MSNSLETNLDRIADQQYAERQRVAKREERFRRHSMTTILGSVMADIVKLNEVVDSYETAYNSGFFSISQRQDFEAARDALAALVNARTQLLLATTVDEG